MYVNFAQKMRFFPIFQFFNHYNASMGKILFQIWIAPLPLYTLISKYRALWGVAQALRPFKNSVESRIQWLCVNCRNETARFMTNQNVANDTGFHLICRTYDFVWRFPSSSPLNRRLQFCFISSVQIALTKTRCISRTSGPISKRRPDLNTASNFGPDRCISIDI